MDVIDGVEQLFGEVGSDESGYAGEENGFSCEVDVVWEHIFNDNFNDNDDIAQSAFQDSRFKIQVESPSREGLRVGFT